MLDAVIISDLHLGSDNCQARRISMLLERIEDGELAAARLILAGDVFDSIDFRRLNKSHWKVLSLLRKMSDHKEIVWLCGNHDGSAEIVSHLLGVRVEDDIVIESGGRKILVCHGHTFDDWLEEHPILTWFADCMYAFLQQIDKTHYLAKVAKKGSKTFVRCRQKIQDGAVELARKRGCQAAVCGHTHHPLVHTEGAVHYFNSGCWTELPGTYLTVDNGVVQLHSFAVEESLAVEPASEAVSVG